MNRGFLILLRYEVLNMVRSRWILSCLFLFAALSFLTKSISEDPHKIVLTLSSISVTLLPLVTLLFTGLYWYNSDRYTQLLLSQPVSRGQLFASRYLTLTLVLAITFCVGTTLGLLSISRDMLLVLGVGCLLIFTFVGMSLLLVNFIDDRMRGIGLAIGVWIYFSLIHDAGLLLMLSNFRDYPLDVPAGILGILNPMGLARMILLINNEGAFLLGHVGALARKFFIEDWGFLIASGVYLIWILLPMLGAYWIFKGKDR